MGEGGGTGRRGIKGREKWDNCNSIINKIYFKKRTYFTVYTFFRIRKVYVLGKKEQEQKDTNDLNTSSFTNLLSKYGF